MQRIGVDLADVVTMRISPRRAWLLVDSLPPDARFRAALHKRQEERKQQERIERLRAMQERQQKVVDE